MQFVPGMQKRVLGKVICEVMIATKLAQKISDLGLMTANQLAKRRGILLRNHARDEFNIFTAVHTRLSVPIQSLPLPHIAT
jgi:uncharacterized membrane protein (UPF0127 family)